MVASFCSTWLRESDSSRLLLKPSPSSAKGQARKFGKGLPAAGLRGAQAGRVRVAASLLQLARSRPGRALLGHCPLRVETPPLIRSNLRSGFWRALALVPRVARHANWPFCYIALFRCWPQRGRRLRPSSGNRMWGRCRACLHAMSSTIITTLRLRRLRGACTWFVNLER